MRTSSSFFVVADRADGDVDAAGVEADLGLRRRRPVAVGAGLVGRGVESARRRRSLDRARRLGRRVAAAESAEPRSSRRRRSGSRDRAAVVDRHRGLLPAARRCVELLLERVLLLERREPLAVVADAGLLGEHRRLDRGRVVGVDRGGAGGGRLGARPSSSTQRSAQRDERDAAGAIDAGSRAAWTVAPRSR